MDQCKVINGERFPFHEKNLEFMYSYIKEEEKTLG
jgi:hypothetical protein